MTKISSPSLSAAKCCGALYLTHRYLSLNFSASAYWTDGFQENSLMPTDHGLRRCKCGNFFLLNELVEISKKSEEEFPTPQLVKPHELTEAIFSARTQKIELAARRNYWQHLNHPYRQSYKAHRDAEEASYHAQWEELNPDRRTWWQRFRNYPRLPNYQPLPNRQITYPPYLPTIEQQSNMETLLQILAEDESLHNNLERAELQRELGLFVEAEQTMQRIDLTEDDFIARLTLDLIGSRQSAPVRYRL